MKSVKMYRTSSCPFCIQAAALLQDLGIPVEEISLDDHPDRRSFTAEILPGHHTVPLVLIDDQAIGGLDTLKQMQAEGTLLPAIQD